MASYPIYEEVDPTSTNNTYSCLFEPTEFADFSHPTATLQPLLSKGAARASQAVVVRQSARPGSKLPPPRLAPGLRKPAQTGGQRTLSVKKPNIFSVESNHYQSVPVVDQQSSHISDASVTVTSSISSQPADRLIRSQTLTSFRSSNQTLSTNGSDT